MLQWEITETNWGSPQIYFRNLNYIYIHLYSPEKQQQHKKTKGECKHTYE